MIRRLIILLLIVGCGIFSPEGICVFPYEDHYECWDGKSEDSCYGSWYDDKTCSEFCEENKEEPSPQEFCVIH